MKHLELSIDREIDFMIKYGLTADELFLYKMIHFAQDEHPEYLSNFFSQNQLGSSILDLLKSLQDKGIINKSYKIPEKGTIFNPRSVDLNENVTRSFMQHSQDLGLELFEAYPNFTMINGKAFSLRNIAKNFKSFDDFCWEYGKAIKFNPLEHQRIMELLAYGVENNLIHSGICDFVISRQWQTIEAFQNGELETFNTNELV